MPNQFTYTNAFFRGEQSLVDRSINVFTRDLPPAMQVLPGQLTSIIAITNSQTSVDVVRRILDFKGVRSNGIPSIF